MFDIPEGSTISHYRLRRLRKKIFDAAHEVGDQTVELALIVDDKKKLVDRLNMLSGKLIPADNFFMTKGGRAYSVLLRIEKFEKVLSRL